MNAYHDMYQELVATPACEYKRLPDGIHEFILHVSSHLAVDMMYEHLHELYRAAQPDGVFRSLVMSEKTNMPVAYTMQRTRAFYAEFPKRPPSRTAIVARKDSTLWGLVDAALKMASTKEVVRFFAPQQRAEAIIWLYS